MIVARWIIEAKFGHRQDVVDSLNRWNERFADTIGWDASRRRLLGGSVGAKESLVVEEIVLYDLNAIVSAIGTSTVAPSPVTARPWRAEAMANAM